MITILLPRNLVILERRRRIREIPDDVDVDDDIGDSD